MISWPESTLKLLNLFLVSVLACMPFAACAQDSSAAFYALSIHTKDGAQIFQVEAARTPQEHEKGLMFRNTLADDKGMLFIFPERRAVSFWMKNTMIPLDMVFIDTDKRIVHIHPMAKPYDESAVPSTKPVIAVLEILGGQAAKRGIHIGDTVETSLLAENTP